MSNILSCLCGPQARKPASSSPPPLPPFRPCGLAGLRASFQNLDLGEGVHFWFALVPRKPTSLPLRTCGLADLFSESGFGGGNIFVCFVLRKPARQIPFPQPLTPPCGLRTCVHAFLIISISIHFTFVIIRGIHLYVNNYVFVNLVSWPARLQADTRSFADHSFLPDAR